MPARRFRAPAGHGEVLAEPGFDAVPGLVEANRRRLDRADVLIGGMRLRELRSHARREVYAIASPSPPIAIGGLSSDVPLLITGHQPELSHPGVWVKNFALHGLARRVGGVGLNLIVDNDTLKAPALRLPAFRDDDPGSVRLEAVPFDRADGEVPYEDRGVLDAGLFASFAERTRTFTDRWGYEPLLNAVWPDADDRTATVGEWFTALRTRRENAWGCDNLELPVSKLAGTEAFARFVGHILADLPRFRAMYNAAIHDYRKANRVRSRNHPAPELAAGEAPFWERVPGGRRKPATAASDPRQLRPRALTLTLFARVCLGDFFLHGIGGGKYDEVTDRIIRDYFGLEPPAYQVLSATLHLPLPTFPATADDVRRLRRAVRDIHWNPQRHLPRDTGAEPSVRALVTERAAVVAAEPPAGQREARREWFGRLHRLTEQLRPSARMWHEFAGRRLAEVEVEVRGNAILRRRDYSWVLYPEATLRPFLQRFLEV